jgi:hypothetical protein
MRDWSVNHAMGDQDTLGFSGVIRRMYLRKTGSVAANALASPTTQSQ